MLHINYEYDYDNDDMAQLAEFVSNNRFHELYLLTYKNIFINENIKHYKYINIFI